MESIGHASFPPTALGRQDNEEATSGGSSMSVFRLYLQKAINSFVILNNSLRNITGTLAFHVRKGEELDAALLPSEHGMKSAEFRRSIPKF
ncbi:hypothetical protein TNCV_1003891 [Trichonephila clavipes]|nr:hypothetical protein TNCV_1003891 [Trichonephila clavipes]